MKLTFRTTNTLPHQSLFDLLQLRSGLLSNMDEKYWSVIGPGPIGEKAEQLRQKTWAIIDAGFNA